MILTNKKQSRSLHFFLLLCFVTNIIIAGDTQNNSCADISTENKTVKQNSNKTDKDPETTNEKIKKTTNSEAENTTTHHHKRKKKQKSNEIHKNADDSYTYLTSAASTLIVTASTLITGGLAYLIYNLATSSNNLLHPENNSLLHATRNNDLKRVETLLKNGANPDIRNDNGETPLIIAANRPTYYCKTKAEKKDALKIVEILLKNGAKPDIRDDYGETPLMIASFKGKPKVVEELLKYKANVNMQGNNGCTALIEATKEHYYSTKAEKKDALKIIEILLKNGADPNITLHDLKTVNPNQYFNISPLINSLRKHNYKNAITLLEYGADPNKGYSEKGCALHTAIKNHTKHKLRQKHSEIKYKYMITQLIAHGADLNKQAEKNRMDQTELSWDQNTPFHLAAKHYDAQTITAFISMGARMNIKNKYGVTPKTVLLDRFGYLKMLTFYKERFKYILSSRLGKKNPPTHKKDLLAPKMIGVYPLFKTTKN